MAAAAWAWRPDIDWFGRRIGDCRRCNAKELTDVVELALAGGAGEQAVVADAVKALWQDVEQEAADELI